MSRVPSPDAVMEELDRILRGAEFAQSERLKRFLRHIVEETLAGRAAELKEYAIGRDVYDRGPVYDPKTDSIVRVESIRLRNKLQQFYQSAGPGNLAIELSKGAYTPVFRLLQEETAVPQATGNVNPTTSERTPKPFRRRWPAAAMVILSLLIILIIGLMVGAGIYRSAHRTSAGLRLAFSVVSPQQPILEAVRNDITQQLRHKLNDVPGFTVLGPATSTADLNLAGNLEQLQGNFRLALEIIEPRSARRIWSQIYEGSSSKPADFVALAAGSAAVTLRARFSGVPVNALLHAPEHLPEAVQWYAKGQEEWMTQRLAGVRASVEMYRRAVAAEPSYAEAYAGIAESELYLQALEDKDEHVTAARIAARQALSLNNRLAVAHAILGNISLFHDWNFVEAEVQLRAAVSLDPEHTPYSYWYALASAMEGHSADALTLLEMTKLVNPRADSVHEALAILHYSQQKYEVAEEDANRALECRPGNRLTLDLRGRIRLMCGRTAAAIEDFSACANSSDDLRRPCLASLGNVLATSGKRAEAEEILRRMRESPGTPHVGMALVAVGLRETDTAAAELELALRAGESTLPFFVIDRRFDPIRGLPRVTAIIDAIHRSKPLSAASADR